MRISDWSSDVCSSDLAETPVLAFQRTNRKEKDYGDSRRHDAESDRGRRPLRPPDPPLEPAHEAVHLRRAQRHPHPRPVADRAALRARSEEHTSELQSLMRISYAVFCLKKTNTKATKPQNVSSTLHT